MTRETILKGQRKLYWNDKENYIKRTRETILKGKGELIKMTRETILKGQGKLYLNNKANYIEMTRETIKRDVMKPRKVKVKKENADTI